LARVLDKPRVSNPYGDTPDGFLWDDGWLFAGAAIIRKRLERDERLSGVGCAETAMSVSLSTRNRDDLLESSRPRPRSGGWECDAAGLHTPKKFAHAFGERFARSDVPTRTAPACRTLGKATRDHCPLSNNKLPYPRLDFVETEAAEGTCPRSPVAGVVERDRQLRLPSLRCRSVSPLRSGPSAFSGLG
jgi:hypothetical protein